MQAMLYNSTNSMIEILMGHFHGDQLSRWPNHENAYAMLEPQVCY